MAEEKRQRPKDEDVTEASKESFPASDPPAFTNTHSGSPQTEPREAATPAGRKRITISGDEARQGRILLKTPFARAVFIGGIALVVILGLIGLSL